MKVIKVMEENWDCLIILDACRYDYFKEYYSLFFEGELIKGISLGSCTYEWLVRNFINYYPDVIYVSANPYVNSYYPVEGFNSRKHFGKIIDVWKYAWNEDFGTVFPQDISVFAIKSLYKFQGKRFIVHYLQPHEPYIVIKKPIAGFPKPNVVKGDVLIGVSSKDVKNFAFMKAYKKAENIVEKILRKSIDIGYGFSWKLRELLKLPPASPMDTYRRLLGIEGLRKAYKGNLIAVLKEAALLINDLISEGYKVVITSDHGEFLGEGLLFCHWCRSKRSILRVVPWFTVKKVKRIAKRPKYMMIKKIMRVRDKLSAFHISMNLST